MLLIVAHLNLRRRDVVAAAVETAKPVLAVEALSEIVATETYVLSDEERAVLKPALDRAKRGEFTSEAEIDEALDKPWS